MNMYRFFGLLALLACLVLPQARAQNWAFDAVAQGLEHPWAVAFLDKGRFLVTERAGRMRVIEADGKVGEPLIGLPPIWVGGQGGLLDVVLAPDFDRSRRIYFCYAEPGLLGNGTALARATLSSDSRRLDNLRVLFSQEPKVNSPIHFGCRIALDDKGLLHLALGERGNRMNDAQTLNNHLGKVIRLGVDGKVPRDNPFAQRKDALPEIWSYGHRNPQGMVLSPEGQLWLIEHGPQGGDELNLVRPGLNYGWPVITHGENYGGGKIGDGLTRKEGMEQPVHHWVPSIAPSGMAFVTTDRYGAAIKANLFVGSLKFGRLHRLELQGGRVVREQIIPVGARVRDVRQGPDGALYLLTDQPKGKLLRLVLR
jgi:glucose/arabinose dehydrogenase